MKLLLWSQQQVQRVHQPKLITKMLQIPYTLILLHLSCIIRLNFTILQIFGNTDVEYVWQ
jgi:hypothetical protein